MIVGQLVTPKLAVDPAGPDTLAVCAMTDPAGDTISIDVTTADGGAHWEGTQLRLSAAGQWRICWAVTGTGAGSVVQTLDVGPAPGDAPDGFSFATTGDLARYSGEAPSADAGRKLIDASREIERLTRTAVYPVDDADGRPADPDLRRALAEATCELVAWWDETGAGTGAASLITNASIAGVSIGYGGRTQGNAQADRVGPRVWTILLNAGLVAGGVLH